jgi:hypothetical protein
MYCSNCGKEVKDGTKFCSKCGKALSAPVKEQEPINSAGSYSSTPIKATVPSQETTRQTPPSDGLAQVPAPNRKITKGFKGKMGEGFEATGEFSYDEVYAIVKQIVGAMGEKTAVILGDSPEDQMILLGFMKPVYQKLLGQGLLNGLLGMKDPDLSAGLIIEKEGGKSKMTLCITEATTVRQTYAFIPVSPKSVEGLTVYRRFMDELVSEISRLSPTPVIEMT